MKNATPLACHIDSQKRSAKAILNLKNISKVSRRKKTGLTGTTKDKTKERVQATKARRNRVAID